MVKGLTGCGLHGYSLASTPIQQLNPIWQFVSKKYIFSGLKYFCFLMFLFVYIIVEWWRRSGGLHQVCVYIIVEWWRRSGGLHQV